MSRYGHAPAWITGINSCPLIKHIWSVARQGVTNFAVRRASEGTGFTASSVPELPLMNDRGPHTDIPARSEKSAGRSDAACYSSGFLAPAWYSRAGLMFRSGLRSTSL